MSGWFNFSRCTIEQDEREKRKTRLHGLAVESIAERRASILNKHPEAIIHVFQAESDVNMTAYDKTGNQKLAEESYHF